MEVEMPINFYPATALTGGGDGALDFIDGANLADWDYSLVPVKGVGIHHYILNASSGASALPPNIIAPITNAGDKRWILHGIYDPAIFNNAKAQLIDSVYSIVTPANVRLFAIFDETGAATFIKDRSHIGGRATPVGSNLITNGGFASDTSSWSGWQATLASVAGGESGNCLEVTGVSGDTQSGNQNVTLVVGKRYRLSGYVKEGSVAGSAYGFAVAHRESPYQQVFSATGTSTGSWVAFTADFVATYADVQIQIYKNSAGAGTILFDTITLFELNSNLSLVDGSLNLIAASTCSPGYSGLAPYLTMDATHQFDSPDAADLSFVSGNDQAFYVAILGIIDNDDGFGIYKGDITNIEWGLFCAAGLGVMNLIFTVVESFTTSTGINATDNTLAADREGQVTCAIGTYDGSETAAGIALQVQGEAQGAGVMGGTYTGMTASTGKLTSLLDASGFAMGTFPSYGKLIVKLVGQEDLSVTQRKRLDAVFRGYAGVY
jgi:hypothetical protein